MAELIDGTPQRLAPPRAAPPAPTVEEKVMSLAEHLGELRRRIVMDAAKLDLSTRKPETDLR